MRVLIQLKPRDLKGWGATVRWIELLFEERGVGDGTVLRSGFELRSTAADRLTIGRKIVTVNKVDR